MSTHAKAWREIQINVGEMWSLKRYWKFNSELYSSNEVDVSLYDFSMFRTMKPENACYCCVIACHNNTGILLYVVLGKGQFPLITK
jgi:hypothetical protein